MMSRKANAKAGKNTAKKNGEPAVKFSAGLDLRNTGTGSGYLDKGIKAARTNQQKKQAEIDKIMKDL